MGDYRFGQLLNAVVFVGYPGSGKGTLINMLDKEKFFHISTGEMFRERKKKDRALADLLAAGYLVSDEETLKQFYAYVNGFISDGSYNPEKQYLTLDGIPRTINQVIELKKDFDIKKVFYVNVPKEMVMERLKNRPDGRPEDKSDEAIAIRLNAYETLTAPTLAHYNPKIIAEIKNTKDLSVMRQELDDIVKNL